MSSYTDLYVSIAEVFNDAQKSASSHEKNYLILRNIFKKSNFDSFLEALRGILRRLAVKEFKNENPHIAKCIDFFVLFCTTLETDELHKNDENEDEEGETESEFLTNIFEYLIELQELSDDRARYRACQIIGKMLKQLLGVSISTDLFDKVQKAMLYRIYDRKMSVALQAISAGCALQDYSIEDCPMLAAFINCLNHPKPHIRKACVETVAVTSKATTGLIERIRDVDASVRSAAYLRISKFPKAINIIKRQAVIKCGLAEESPLVRKAFEKKLLIGWLDAHNKDILSLMKALRLDANEKDIQDTTDCVEGVLDILFRQTALRSNVQQILKLDGNLIPVDGLNWETVRFWKFAVEYFRKGDLEDSFTEEILPEFIDFCKYIKQYCDSKENLSKEEYIEHQFILSQLFTILNGYDFADPVHRQFYNSFIRDTLIEQNLNSNVISIIVSGLNASLPDIGQQVQFLTEIASEILYVGHTDEPIGEPNGNKEFEIAEIAIKVNCVTENMNNALNNNDYQLAEKFKKELANLQVNIRNLQKCKPVEDSEEEEEKEEEKEEEEEVKRNTDTTTIVKYLEIILALLQLPKIKTLNPTLRMIKDETIEGYLQHKNEDVHLAALKSYQYCCMLDETSAETGIHILCSPILAYSMGQECDERTLLIAIKGATELVVKFGPRLLANSQEEQASQSSINDPMMTTLQARTSLKQLVQGLVDLMTDENPEIQEQATLHLCKLILHRRVCSPYLIARMIIAWYSPPHKNHRITQMIAKTLELFSTFSDSGKTLEGAFVYTINILLKVPKTSSLASVNILKMAKCLLTLCNCCEDKTIHTNLALLLMAEMRKKVCTRNNTIYSRILLILELPVNDPNAIQKLLETSETVRDQMKDNVVVKNLIKFTAYLNEMKSLPSVPESEEE